MELFSNINAAGGFFSFSTVVENVQEKPRVFSEFADQIAEMNSILSSDRRFAKIQSKKTVLKTGELVGVRPNLNSPKHAPVPVQTIHRGSPSRYRSGKGFWNGEVLLYAAFVELRNVYFNVDRTAREKIAGGTVSKFPMASVDGEFFETPELNASGLEIRFNPKLHSSFVDNAGRSIEFAEEATVFGNRVYARGKIFFSA